MYEKFASVTIGGRDYKLLFSLAAMAQIVERFGSVTEMTELAERSQGEAIKVVPWLFAVLATQGEYLDKGGKGEIISEEWAGVHLMPSDISAVMSACNLAMARGMGMEHAASDDDEVDVVLEELSKNAVGAEV